MPPLHRCLAGFVGCLLGACLLPGLAGAQPFPARLPTPQGGDYGNGAASSDVAGGAFLTLGASRAPAVAFGIPTAYGAQWRDVYAGAGAQNGLRGDTDFTDGALFLGGGLGNAERLVGLEVTLAVYDVVGATGKDGSWSAKLHRRFARSAVGVGVENGYIFGNTDGGRSRYAVGSTVVPLRDGARWVSEAALVLGVGDGRFTPWNAVEDRDNRLSPFGSAALRVAPWGGVFATWTGQNLNAGVSLAPFPRVPIQVTPVLLDLTNRHAGDPVRLAFGTGIAATIR